MNKLTTLKEHLDFKRMSVNSNDKIKDIARYLGRFLNSTKKPLDKFQESDLTKFLNSLDFKTGTLNNIKIYLKVFIKWYFTDYSSRFRNLDKICENHKAQKPQGAEDMLSLKEVEKLINGENDLMWKVYWLVFFYGGLRPSEACSLDWKKNIDFDSKGITIKIFSKKNGKNFYKSLPKNAEEYLSQWKDKNNSDWVFPSPIKEGSHIVSKSVYHRLKHLSKRVLGKHIYPYCLRRSIATIKYNDDNLKDDDVANQMGHSKSMKDVYVQLDEDQIKARARKMYVKPKKLTPEEQDELEELRKQIKEIKEEMKKNFIRKDQASQTLKEMFETMKTQKIKAK